VQVFGPDLTPALQFGRKGDMPGTFAQPKGIGADAEGRIYVVDANFEAVQVFDREGTLLMTFGREGRGPGEFWLPAGLWIDAGGRIWIADSYNQRVQVFDFLPGGATP
jgi:DNA-binding beta-propeller fold protein YncE